MQTIFSINQAFFGFCSYLGDTIVLFNKEHGPGEDDDPFADDEFWDDDDDGGQTTELDDDLDEFDPDADD